MMIFYNDKYNEYNPGSVLGLASEGIDFSFNDLSMEMKVFLVRLFQICLVP